MNTNKENLKTFVRGAYDLQKLRIQMGNRMAANFRAKLGLKSSEKEETDEDAQKILETLRVSYKKLTDGVKSFPRQSGFKGDEVISTYTELTLFAQYHELEANESKHFRRMEKALEEFPIYKWLKSVKGCGPAMSGLIISEIDIHKAEYPSSIWKYCGFDVAPDGKGRSRKKEHLVEVEYTDKDGKKNKRMSITFNPLIKTKLYVLATCIIKAGGTYREIYDNYKHRLEHHKDWAEKSKGHRHNAALRYMIKIFLRDLYNEWRVIEDLPVAPDYSEAKLGKKHKKA
jgi:hypothetical protein